MWLGAKNLLNLIILLKLETEINALFMNTKHMKCFRVQSLLDIKITIHSYGENDYNYVVVILWAILF